MTTLGSVMRLARVLAALSVGAAAVGGCESRPLDDGPAATPETPANGGTAGTTTSATGAGGGPASPPAMVPLPAGVTPAPYVNVAHEAGTCADAAGATPIATTSAAQVASLLVGRWRLCSAYSPYLELAPHDGMELARDRSWRLLVAEGDSLTPSTASSSAGRWYMSAEDPSDMVAHEQSVVRIFPDGNVGANGYPVALSQHPTVMLLGHTLTYVWVGD
jgi:hypothetical protein